MLTRRQVIEQHIKRAEEALKERTATLKERNIEGKKGTAKDVTFREVQAVLRQYHRRLKALDKADAVNVDVETRRAVRLSTPKVPKEKKKKPVAPVKGKAGNAPKKEKKAAS